MSSAITNAELRRLAAKAFATTKPAPTEAFVTALDARLAQAAPDDRTLGRTLVELLGKAVRQRRRDETQELQINALLGGIGRFPTDGGLGERLLEHCTLYGPHAAKAACKPLVHMLAQFVGSAKPDRASPAGRVALDALWLLLRSAGTELAAITWTNQRLFVLADLLEELAELERRGLKDEPLVELHARATGNAKRRMHDALVKLEILPG